MSDVIDPRGRVDVLARRVANAIVDRIPGARPHYDQYVSPLVDEAIARALPEKPLTLVDVADSLGLLPAKPKANRGRRKK